MQQKRSGSPAPVDSIVGVNLGNWLVLEKWMEPRLFAHSGGSQDEYTLAHTLPSHQLARRLQEHRQTYLTEEDFAYMTRQGINMVRLPVPHFVFGDCPSFIGCIEYVDKAFSWAGEHKMTILLDLHTVPGSQNGYDSSGRIGPVAWHKSASQISFALSVLERLADRYGNNPALFGIEVLNEPKLPLSFLERFYLTAYRRLRRRLPADKALVFYDGFNLLGMAWIFALHPRMRSMTNVYLDTHLYLTFAEQGLEKAFRHTPDRHQPSLRRRRLFYSWGIRLAGAFIRLVDHRVPVIVGEWCAESSLGKLGLDDEFQEARQAEFTPYFTPYIADLQKSIFKRRFFWSYQLERDPALREKMRGTWRSLWDWRLCAEEGVV